MAALLIEPPLIGITASFEKETQHLNIRRHYCDAVLAAGGLPVVLPLGVDGDLCGELLKRLDGIVFSGGADVDPVHYGQEKSPRCGAISPERDAAEKALIQYAFSHDVPMFGICRGMQAMNVWAGGTLIQDIDERLQTSVRHVQAEPYPQTTHTVTVQNSDVFERIVGGHVVAVNSRHHQAVDRPAPGSQVLAASTDDGVIEAIAFCHRRCAFAVQWHPEMLFEELPEHLALFEFFVSTAGDASRRVSW